MTWDFGWIFHSRCSSLVIPAQAGIQFFFSLIVPAKAGFQCFCF